MTSAGVKTSFAYERLVDDFVNAIIDPKSTFVFGCDYRVPMKHNLIDKTFINRLKMSPSYNENSFAREYLGLWSGSSDDSWLDVDKLKKYRKIKNPEKHAQNGLSSTQFYLLAVDVGRISDQTVVTVFKCGLSNNKYYCTVVNIIVLGRTDKDKPFVRQAIDLKKLIAAFNPKEVVIDTNGLGVGLGDEMIRQQIDKDGTVYPAYGFINDKNYKATQPKDAIEILYGIKASGDLNSDIHANVFSRLRSGLVRFLITEQEAKSILMSTKVGQKMSPEKRIERLMPHEMTSRLFDEIANLTQKRVGTKIVLERINEHFPKDKYSSFAYGLWRIKELEEKNYKKVSRRQAGVRRLIFFHQGGEN